MKLGKPFNLRALKLTLHGERGKMTALREAAIVKEPALSLLGRPRYMSFLVDE